MPLYVFFVSGDSTAALNGFQACLASVHSWMLTNKDGSPAAECSTDTQTAGVRAQLTAVSCGLRQRHFTDVCYLVWQ